MGVNGQCHASAPIVQEIGWAPEPVWMQRLEEKSSVFGDRTPVIQSVVTHYTDWATRLNIRMCCNEFKRHFMQTLPLLWIRSWICKLRLSIVSRVECWKWRFESSVVAVLWMNGWAAVQLRTLALFRSNNHHPKIQLAAYCWSFRTRTPVTYSPWRWQLQRLLKRRIIFSSRSCLFP
jgi:hypothetical protein